MAEQVAKQNVQIALQNTQIALSAEQNRIIGQQGTVTARQIEEQQARALPVEDNGFSPTATAIAETRRSAEATRQALNDQLQRIEATQTALAKAPPSYTESIAVPICGEQVFRTEFLTDGRANVEINLPAGYVYAFVSSDPALVEFSNGTHRLFNTQFVLVAKDFSRITIKSVGTRIENGNKIVNSWACAYGSDGAQAAEQSARQDYNLKIIHNNIVELYRVDTKGFTLLASNLNK